MNTKNSEGYQDRTASEAIASVRQQEKQDSDVRGIIRCVNDVVSLAGYELSGDITFTNKRTRKKTIWKK